MLVEVTGANHRSGKTINNRFNRTTAIGRFGTVSRITKDVRRVAQVQETASRINRNQVVGRPMMAAWTTNPPVSHSSLNQLTKRKRVECIVEPEVISVTCGATSLPEVSDKFLNQGLSQLFQPSFSTSDQPEWGYVVELFVASLSRQSGLSINNSRNSSRLILRW